MDAPGTGPPRVGTHTVLDVLDASAVRRWGAVAVGLLESHRDEIDTLNVFPVADGDTGTNLANTVRAAVGALADDAAADTAAAALHVLAVGAAIGAHGNSGAIVSQVLRGLAESALAAQPCDGVVLAAGLARGAALARSAVADPVEGTILTVAAAAASAAGAGAGLGEVVVAAVAAAVSALDRTPQQLALLADRGVVDAGGRGLVLLLDALAQVVTGTSAMPLALARQAPAPAAPSASGAAAVVDDHACAVEDPAFPFEVEYLLDAAEHAIPALRARLTALGDSVVLAGTGTGTWKVHVHVADAGAAIEAGIEAGRPRQVSVVRFADQIAAHAHAHDRPHRTTVLALVPHAGLAHLFAAEGAHVRTDEARTPDDVAGEIDALGTNDVVVLPNSVTNQDVCTAGVRLARQRSPSLRVVVVPTASIVQGLAAVAVHDSGRRFDDDVVAMAEAAAATRTAEVVIASDGGVTPAGRHAAGDVLGVLDGAVVQIGRSPVSVAFTLLDRLLGMGAELVTIVVADSLVATTADVLRTFVRERAPLAEVVLYGGGPQHRPLLFGAE